MRKIIAGNWKQNGRYSSCMKLAKSIISRIKKNKCKHEIIIFPPSIYLLSLKHVANKSSLKIGAQNVSAYEDGPFTGEISSSMLKDSGVQYCLVGHSERRHVFNESSSTLNKKIIYLGDKTYLGKIKKELSPVQIINDIEQLPDKIL